MISTDPQQLGEFRILEKLGDGGMGAVYKAQQSSLGRIVALKVLTSQLASDGEFIDRFKAEARSAASLNHSGIVQVYAAGEDDGVHWFAMEFVDGESLQGRLTRKGRIEPMEAVAICIHVAAALNHGWQRARLIHRDIKPDNVFLSHDGEVKLGDLGLAKSLGSENARLTQTGFTMGTPFYVSPEQARSDAEIDFRSDIYNLGGTLFHLLSGQPPYRGSGPMAVMIKHVTEPAPDIFQVWPECPRPVGPLLARMLAKEPEARFQSYEALMAEMTAVHSRLEKLATRPWTGKLPQIRFGGGPGFGVSAAIVGIVLALTLGGWWWMSGKKAPEAAPIASQVRSANEPPPSGSPATPVPDGFISMFNGRDLSEWSGDPKHWSVRNGAIVGESTPWHPINTSTFLIWNGGPVEDFILRASFILSEGNSGVQYRSRMIDPVNWMLGGYQFDMDATQRDSRGALYEERGREYLAHPGEHVRWRADGTKELLSSTSGAAPWQTEPQWNKLTIIAQGNHLRQELNGMTVAEVVDDDPAGQAKSGFIGLQALRSTGLKVQFRDLFLKRLPRENGDSAPSSLR